MNPSAPTCPKCGSAFPDDSPGGLCPKCALSAAAANFSTGQGNRRIAPPDVSEVAPHFPDLEVVELIGAGGMGAVYKARQPRLDRFIALKILLHDPKGDPAFVERFSREAKVLARLSHPNIVTVHDFGTVGPFCYLIMELVDGINLREAMRAGGFPPAETLDLVQDVCAALQYAHGEGILHRDIKPENILLDARGRVKIADFGIAKLLGETDPADVTLTVQGSALGSPHYMAPEQFESPSDVDARADIYSLGVVFYEMLTGELPIGRFEAPSEKSPLDPRVDPIVMRALEKNRQRRYQTAGEVGSEVGSITRSGLQAPEPAASQAQVAPGAPTDTPTARFATLSAILTGLSLVAGLPLLGLAIWLFGEMDRTNDFRPIVLGLGILVFSVPALLGTIVGGIALGEIRRSGGRKTGVGRATFGATAWPVLLIAGYSFMVFLLAFSARQPEPNQVANSSAVILAPLILGLIGGGGVVAATTLVGGVKGWASCNPRWRGVKRCVITITVALLLPPLAVFALMVS